MPWCGYWGTTGPAYWWVLPLIGLVFMAVMFFACFRGFGCMGGCRRGFGGDRQPVSRGREDEAPRSGTPRNPS